MREQTAAGKALRLWVHRAVLGVNQKPVVPRAAQLLSDGGRATVEEEAHLRLTSLQLGLEDFPTLIGDRHFGVLSCVCVCDSCAGVAKNADVRFESALFQHAVCTAVSLVTIHVTSVTCATPPILLLSTAVDEEPPVSVWIHAAKDYFE